MLLTNLHPSDPLSDGAYLLLEDGRDFEGEAVGARGIAFGEVVFNTSMTGYQEILTDPSSAGQLVAMTYPLIGNYGATRSDEASPGPRAAGIIVREMARRPSNWRAEESLQDYLSRTGVVGLAGIDTRALTLHLRSAGTMRAAIAPAAVSREELLEQVLRQPRPEDRALAAEVTTGKFSEIAPTAAVRHQVHAYDFGATSSAFEQLAVRGCRVTAWAAETAPEALVEAAPDGLFLSSGPGDPQTVRHILRAIRLLAERGVPVFGIGLGHQLIARAFGGATYKLVPGHRGANHPVRRLDDGGVEITAQNHGYAVRAGQGGEILDAPGLRVTHVSLNDQSVEGLAHRELPVLGIQYDPSVSPRPRGSLQLFDRFVDFMADARGES